MKLDSPLHLTITPTYLAVMEKFTPEEVDSVLRKSFPGAFETEEEKEQQKDDLLNLIQTYKPKKPLMSLEQAMRETREQD